MSRINNKTMYIAKRSSLFFLIPIFLLSPLAIFAGEWCAIDKWPWPELAKYIREVGRMTSEIRSQASANNQCNWVNGSFTNEKKFTSLLDRIDAENPAFPNLIQDFQYNILLVANGDSRAPVRDQGIVLRNLETSIINTLKSVSSVCALGVSYQDGTFESALTAMLMKNKKVESYFKSVAVGDTRNIDNINASLAWEIAANYTPEMTKSCKDTSNIADNVGKLLERIQNFGKKTEDSDKNWKEAIALFRWGSNTQNYNNLQKSLLNNELSRQWLSHRAISLMIGNLTCSQNKSSQNDTEEEKSKNNSACYSNMVIGAENLTNWMKTPIIKATNADQYLARVLLYNQRKDQSSIEMTNFWTDMETLIKTDEETTNDKILTDLVDLHVELIKTNKLIKARIPEMQENCRKWQPGIPCPK